MRHFITVKFRPGITSEEKESMYPDIAEIFDGTRSIDGIHDVILHKNCTPRDNRYDIMIEMVMEKEALDAYDGCRWHLLWKEKYGGLIEKKAIFDCDD